MKDKNLTLIILVRDRQINIPIVSKYYSDLECPKIIFDSSVRPFKDVPMLKKRGFKYVYFGPMTIWEKRHKCLSYIETDYVLENPDDDVTLKPSIRKAVNFLEENKDYVCGYGEFYYFNKKSFWPKNPKKHTGALTLNFRSEDPLERIKTFMTSYPLALNHTVMRSSVFKEFHTLIYQTKALQYMNYLDRLFSIFILTKGNVKALPTLFQFRKKGNERVFLKHKKEVNARQKLSTHLTRDVLLPFATLLSKASGKSKQKCFSFLRQTLNRHFSLNRKKGKDWTTIDIKTTKRNYRPKLLKEFKNTFF